MDLRSQVSKLNKSKPVVVYCAAGGRSAGAAKVLKGLNFEEIYNYTGGFNDWKSRGEDVEK